MPDTPDPMREIERAMRSMDDLASGKAPPPSPSTPAAPRGEARPQKELPAVPKASPKASPKAAAQPAEKRPWTFRRFFFTLLGGAFALVLLLALPFVTLVRASVYLYLDRLWLTWPALAAAAGLAAVVLFIYACLVAWKLHLRPSRWVAWSALWLVVLYCGYALLYINGVHVKDEAERVTYTALHPMLRLAVSTFTLLDGDLVVTDTERVAEDYAAMGLPALENSMHYRQEDGYAHAIDLRTLGRDEWKNSLMTAYFELMGFQTLRHIGTADHLHVTLPVR